MKDTGMRRRGKEVPDTVRQCTTLIHKLPPHIISRLIQGMPDEELLFLNAAGFLEKEFGVPVTVRDAGESTHPKAVLALPFKPALVVE
jgi:leucyl-tRNA synthetase